MTQTTALGRAGEPETDPTPVFECRDVVVRYGAQRAVDEVSLGFRPASVTGIIGPNGAGKTSLINVLSASLRPASGELYLDQRDVTRLSPYKLARRGLIRTFQSGRVFADLSVLDNLLVAVPGQRGERFRSALLGSKQWHNQEIDAQSAALALLADFHLDHAAHLRCGNLSGGQQKIIEYLRALVARPRVLLLDEPSAGLAPPVVQRLGSDLKRLAGSGCCVIVIEHEMGLIEAICDRVVGMAAGRIIVDGDFATAVGNELLQSAYIGRR
ncbi:MAG: ABC transporter ATP-binding protein [Acidimicrobiales bacterium]